MTAGLTVPVLAAGPFRLRPIGYWVAPPARGQHAAGHALTAVARWALGELAIPRLELCVEPWNGASARTAFVTGFRCEARLRSWRDVGGERKDFDLYAMLFRPQRDK